ncbi:MAG: hypothetical protein ACI9L9_002454 [Marivirga sp.]
MLKTLEVSQLAAGGAVFNASFLNSTAISIDEYGFVWSTGEEKTNIAEGERISKSLKLTENGFSVMVSSVLRKEQVYYLRSYIIVDELTIYGNAVKFIGQGGEGPEILSISPSSGTLGDTISLKGNRFSYQDNFVYLDNAKTTIISATDTLITFLVPDRLTNKLSGILVETSNQRTSVEDVFTFILPSITGLSKQTAKSLDTINVYGTHLGNIKRHVELFLNEELIDFGYKKDTLQLIVPLSLQWENNELKVKVNNIEDSLSFDHLLPSFAVSSYGKYTWLDTVSLKVANFNHNRSPIKLKVNNNYIPIIDASDSLVRFVISEVIAAEKLELSAEVAGNEVVLNSPIFMKKPYVKEIDTDTLYFGKSVLIALGNGHPNINQIKIGAEIVALEEAEGSVFKFTVPFSDNIYTNINENDQVQLELNCNSFLYDSIITLKDPVSTQVIGVEDSRLSDTLTIMGNYLSGNPSISLNFKSVIKDFTGSTQFELVNYVPKIINQSDEQITFSYDIREEELLDIDQEIVIDYEFESYGRTVSTPSSAVSIEKSWSIGRFLPAFEFASASSSFLDEKIFGDDDFGYIIGGKRTEYDQYGTSYYQGIEKFYRFNLDNFDEERLWNWKGNYSYHNIELAKDDIAFVISYKDEIFATSTRGMSLIYNKANNRWVRNYKIPFLSYTNYIKGFKSGDYIVMVNNQQPPKVYSYNTITEDTVTKLITPFKDLNHGYVFDLDNSVIIYSYLNENLYDIYQFNAENLELMLVKSNVKIDLSSYGTIQNGIVFDSNGIYQFNPMSQEMTLLKEFPIDGGIVKFLFNSQGKFFFNIDNKNIVSIVMDGN